MDYSVISLRRTPERLAAFKADNEGVVPFDVFEAVDGTTLTDLDPDLIDSAPYSKGSLGAAFSHIQLWKRTIERRRSATIFEDDAILHPAFKRYQNTLLGALGQDWDIVLWGWNFDSILHLYMQDGLGEAIMRFDQRRLQQAPYSFREFEIQPALHRLKNAFGFLSYSISPQGAGKLLSRTLPLRAEAVPIEGLGRTIANFSLDVVVNNYYAEVGAFASFPPLAVSPNDQSKTTIVER